MSYRFSRLRRGQAVVEYILLTALTALATVAIFRVFRADIATAYQKAGKALVNGVDEGVSSTVPAPIE
jgi:Flp pilus assembly pilin Flp